MQDRGSIPWSGRSPGEGHGNPLQCSCLEHPMDRGAWQVTVQGVPKSWTQLKWLSMHACIHTHTYLPYVFSIANKMMLLAHSEKAVAMGICVILLKNNLTVLLFFFLTVLLKSLNRDMTLFWLISTTPRNFSFRKSPPSFSLRWHWRQRRKSLPLPKPKPKPRPRKQCWKASTTTKKKKIQMSPTLPQPGTLQLSGQCRQISSEEHP